MPERLERVGVLLVVGVAEVAGRALGAGDALDQDVVVLGGLVVVTGGGSSASSSIDLAGHVVVGAGVGAGTEQRDLLVGEARVELVPVGDLGVRRPQLDELVDGQAVDGEVGVDDDGQRVGGDLELGVLDPGLLTDAISSSSIGREASEMSVSSAQKRSKPPPVPASETVTWTSGFSSLRSSWAAVLIGKTVEEPSTTTLPLAPPRRRRRPSSRTGVCAAAGGQGEHGDHRDGREEELGLSLHRGLPLKVGAPPIAAPSCPSDTSDARERRCPRDPLTLNRK